jgi:FkbM family methyltransferase
LNYFDSYKNIKYLIEDDLNHNVKLIKQILNLDNYIEYEVIADKPNTAHTFNTLEGKKDFSDPTKFVYPNSMQETMLKYGEAAAMYWGTFVYKELDRNGIEVELGDTFVDLGANIGMSSKYALLKGAKEVYCFEPDPNLIALLKENIPTAIIHQNAIDNTNQEIELYHWPYNEISKGPKYKVSTVTLKDILDAIDTQIDYLKVDIEGFEHSGIFNELTKEDFSKIKKIFIECHDKTKTQNLIDILNKNGYEVYSDFGYYQNYIYAKTKSNTNKETANSELKFHSNWNAEEQKIYYSCSQQINYPIIVSLKEYKSDAVMWSTQYTELSTNIDYWMIPIPKQHHDYSKDVNFTGVKLCIYNKETGEQLYEEPHFIKFVDVPTISMSNQTPYYINYCQFFIEKKDNRFLKDLNINLVVDVGANIGLFTKYLMHENIGSNYVCIECDPEALGDLSNNYKYNTNVTIIPKALSIDNAPIKFYKFGDNTAISSTLSLNQIKHHGASVNSSNEITVESITISDIIKKYGHIGLLKIDIEGGEYNIIDSLAIEDANHIDYMLIECHWFEEDYELKYKNLIEKLNLLGYEVIESKENQMIAGGSDVIFAKNKQEI